MPFLRIAEGDLDDLCAGHHGLEDVLGGVDAAGDGEIGLDAARKNGDPMQARSSNSYWVLS